MYKSVLLLYDDPTPKGDRHCANIIKPEASQMLLTMYFMAEQNKLLLLLLRFF